MKKQLLVAGAVATASAVGLMGASAYAVTQSTAAGSDPMSSLVSDIATKFKLNKDDVQKVFDENRTKMDAEREQEVKDQVAQLVKDGKLTQEQADKINAKRAELQKQRDERRTSDSTQTQEERRSHMDTMKSELDTWMTDNDIPNEYHYLLMGGGKGHGMGDGRGMHDRDGSAKQQDSRTSDSDTSTAN